MTEWFSPQEAGRLGGLLGAVVGGVGGGVLGPMIGLLAPRGKCKALVLALQVGFAAVGAALLAAGLYALAVGQPAHVYGPLVLVGLIGAVVIGGLLPVTLYAYRLGERRRLAAEEFRRS